MFRVMYRGMDVWCQSFEALSLLIDGSNPAAVTIDRRALPPPRVKRVIVRKRKIAPVAPAPALDTTTDLSAAAQDRNELLAAIRRSEVGLSIGELKRAVPNIEGQRRSNALTGLKKLGLIKRAGNAWVRVN